MTQIPINQPISPPPPQQKVAELAGRGLQKHSKIAAPASEAAGGALHAVPPQRAPTVRSVAGGLDWLAAGMLGRAAAVQLAVGEAADAVTLRARVSSLAVPRPGDRLRLAVEPRLVHVFPAAG